MVFAKEWFFAKAYLALYGMHGAPLPTVYVITLSAPVNDVAALP